MQREYALSLIDNKELLNAVLDFNSVHESSNKESLSSFYAQYPSFMRDIEETDLVLFKKQQKISYFDFSYPKSRVIFLDKETLDKIAVYLGSCVFADCITTTILKNELLCLSQAIGSSVYKFVMEHGRYVFGGTVKRHYSSKRDVKLVLQETKRQGYSILGFFAGSLSKNYQDFLLRKIAELDVEFEKQQQWSLDQDKLFSLICFIAINEIDGKWKKYFI